MTKKCNACGEIKALDDFHKHAGGRFGRRSACKECDKKKHAEYYIRNKEECDKRNAAWYMDNKDRHNSRCSERQRLASPEEIKAYKNVWRARNPDAGRRYGHNRRSRENGQKLSRGIGEKLFSMQRGKCACCAASLDDGYHIDHIMPLARGGSNTDDNVQLLCPFCNRSKGAKHPVDFMRQRGFLI